MLGALIFALVAMAALTMALVVAKRAHRRKRARAHVRIDLLRRE